MGFKAHKKMATRTKREKVVRERENGLKIGKPRSKKWQRGLKGEKKFKLPRATKVV
jgi:hypothetical protein